MTAKTNQRHRVEKNKKFWKVKIITLSYCKKIVLFIALTTCTFVHTQNIWECDFGKTGIEGWKVNRLLHEIIDGSLRVKVAPKAHENYGTFHKYVPSGDKDYYLQVQMGNLEGGIAEPRVANVSTDGKLFGPLLSGWNTFSMLNVKDKIFALSFIQTGNGDKDGAWVDYVSARIVKTPKNGLTVTLKSNNDTAKIGDKLIFRYYAEKPLATQTLEARCFIASQFIDYRFNKNATILLRNTGIDNIYEAQVDITADALAYKSDPKTRLMAVVKIEQITSYFTLPFKLNIKTANVIPKTMISAANPQVRSDRQLWFDRIQGDNVARGKPISMSLPPDYRLTKSDTDPTDLTDGKLTVNADDKIWFDKGAVGWHDSGNEIYLKIDLGKEQPLDRLVIRYLGGTTGYFKFPKQLDLYVSKDNNTWFSAASMQKLMPGESYRSDFKNYYYLDESAPQYVTRMYPFELGIRSDARYVVLRIIGDTSWIFSDELAIIKAENRSTEFNQSYQSTGIAIPMDGLVIRPRVTELAVIKNLPTPQRFNITDMRKKKEKEEPASLILELPESLELISPKVKDKLVEIGGRKYRHFEFPLNYNKTTKKFESPTLFLGATDNNAGAPAYIYARCGEQDQFKTELPVKVVELQPIEPFERLHISLSWMVEWYGMNWPDFFKNWRKLGFNTVSSFPRYWATGINRTTDARKDYIVDARKAGFKIIMNESPFYDMMLAHEAGSEIFCQIPGKTHTILCPSYRGSYYDKEIERVARCVYESKPDYVFHDIECWFQSLAGAFQCTRCQEAQKRSGKSMNEFVLDCGTEYMRDLNSAVKIGAKQAGIMIPEQGSYDRHPLTPLYPIDDFERIYPAYISMAQPSLYVSGSAKDVHDSIRGNYKLLKNKQIIPWLTAGTYGEFESYKIEQMILEALLNGARGVTYFDVQSFTDSPLDFYYHAKALAQIRPYEDLIADGEVLEPTGTNSDFLYSGIKREGEMLLLAGNYFSAPEETTIRLPFSKIKGITDLRSRKKVGGNSDFTFKVPKGDIRLFHITGE